MGLYDGIKKNYSRKTNFKLNESCKSKNGNKKAIKESDYEDIIWNRISEYAEPEEYYLDKLTDEDVRKIADNYKLCQSNGGLDQEDMDQIMEKYAYMKYGPKNESSKGKKGKKKLNEMGNFAGRMDKLRAARGRADVHNNNVKEQAVKRASELLNGLAKIQEDVPELKEIASSVNLWKLKDEYNIWLDASGRGLDYETKDPTLRNSDMTLIVGDKIILSTFGAKDTIDSSILEDYGSSTFKCFVKAATELVDIYPEYMRSVNQLIDDYDLKYPEIKESGSKAGAEKRKAGRRKKNLEWLKSQVDKKPMADLSDEDKKAITKSIDKSLSTYKECNKKKSSKTMVERAKSRKRNPIIESGRTYTKGKNKLVEEEKVESDFWSDRKSKEINDLFKRAIGSDNLDYIKEQLDKIYAIAKKEIVG